MTRSKLPDAVRDIELQDAVGARQRLGDALNGPALLVLLRHYGCIGCEELLTSLKPHLSLFSALNIRVVLIGNGSVEQLQAFQERMHLRPSADLSVLTDPELKAYRALELKRSFWAAAGAGAWLGELQAMGRGFRRGSIQGDALQQGGLLLLDDAGGVRFEHRSETQTDHVDWGVLLAAANRLGAEQAAAAGHVLV